MLVWPGPSATFCREAEFNVVPGDNFERKMEAANEMEWMEVFETKKAEAQTLKTEIDKTDKEIDQMVYELYGLTIEEIQIIENN